VLEAIKKFFRDSIEILPRDEFLDEIEKPNSIHACGMESHYTDDIEGWCDRCGITVYYRPDAKKAYRKLCLPCVVVEVGNA